MKTVKVEDNQTILDVAIQHYGTAEAIGEILLLNPNLRSDETELSRAGYDHDVLALELKLAVGRSLVVDDESKLQKKNVLKKIDKPVTTYEDGKND